MIPPLKRTRSLLEELKKKDFLCDVWSLHPSYFCNPLNVFLEHSLPPGHSGYSLSKATAVYLGDGVGGHGATDATTGRGTLGNWSDAVRRVLTGRRQGRITGHAQTILCRRQETQKVNGGTVDL